MSTVTIHEVKTYLSRLINRVLRGEEMVIARGNKPLVKKEDLPLVTSVAVFRRYGVQFIV
ncbi:MAG: type II toxin-antitoxin system Phd/YefM family antitoxin [Spirochaetaceae bacterium]|nr:MAG: type II toxin-antitoxin system Phd/YefM family antitoxin [Spirochaetaceae bacterium]